MERSRASVVQRPKSLGKQIPVGAEPWADEDVAEDADVRIAFRERDGGSASRKETL